MSLGSIYLEMTLRRISDNFLNVSQNFTLKMGFVGRLLILTDCPCHGSLDLPFFLTQVSERLLFL